MNANKMRDLLDTINGSNSHDTVYDEEQIFSGILSETTPTVDDSKLNGMIMEGMSLGYSPAESRMVAIQNLREGFGEEEELEELEEIEEAKELDFEEDEEEESFEDGFSDIEDSMADSDMDDLDGGSEEIDWNSILDEAELMEGPDDGLLDEIPGNPAKGGGTWIYDDEDKKYHNDVTGKKLNSSQIKAVLSSRGVNDGRDSARDDMKQKVDAGTVIAALYAEDSFLKLSKGDEEVAQEVLALTFKGLKQMEANGKLSDDLAIAKNQAMKDARRKLGTVYNKLSTIKGSEHKAQWKSKFQKFADDLIQQANNNEEPRPTDSEIASKIMDAILNDEMGATIKRDVRSQGDVSSIMGGKGSTSAFSFDAMGGDNMDTEDVLDYTDSFATGDASATEFNKDTTKRMSKINGGSTALAAEGLEAIEEIEGIINDPNLESYANNNQKKHLGKYKVLIDILINADLHYDASDKRSTTKELKYSELADMIATEMQKKSLDPGKTVNKKMALNAIKDAMAFFTEVEPAFPSILRSAMATSNRSYSTAADTPSESGRNGVAPEDDGNDYSDISENQSKLNESFSNEMNYINRLL